ncbi:hypothetical protein MMYC01_209344 [Madurella mycetomatis]|uniref:Uncharacterized protein n=1 Tax=Madurella mycetomatis TaxID=100816 RepID=A0A175VT01_9PEZI|nr:hypothetical protein MMYC01_209344 [Madurella mycetomatis]
MATPSYALTQFTPAPSCGIGTALWAVTKTCYMYASEPATLEINPPWMSCTAVQAGDPPDRYNRECHNDGVSALIDDDGITTYFSACPVGYTAATSFIYPPFYRTFTTTSSGTETITRVEASDVLASRFYCCPSASGFHYKHVYPEDNTITTVHDGTTFSGASYLLPLCRATRVAALSGQTVTLTPYSDTMAWERRRQAETGGHQELITEVWDDAKIVYAGYEAYAVTVFADGHSCYSNCSDYWLNWYTSPERLPTTETSATPTITDGPGPSETANTSPGGGSGGGVTPTSTVASGAHRVGLGGGWARAGALLVATAVAATLAI